MIKNINKSESLFKPEIRTYIEAKAQIDVKHLAIVVPDNDKVELSDSAKNAAQDWQFMPIEPKSDRPMPENADIPTERLDIYF